MRGDSDSEMEVSGSSSASESENDIVLSLISDAMRKKRKRAGSDTAEKAESSNGSRLENGSLIMRTFGRKKTKMRQPNGSPEVITLSDDNSDSEGGLSLKMTTPVRRQKGHIPGLQAVKDDFADINAFLDHNLLDTIAKEEQIADDEEKEDEKVARELKRLLEKHERAAPKVFRLFSPEKKSGVSKRSKYHKKSRAPEEGGIDSIDHSVDELFGNSMVKVCSMGALLLNSTGKPYVSTSFLPVLVERTINCANVAAVRDNIGYVQRRYSIVSQKETLFNTIGDIVQLLGAIGVNEKLLDNVAQGVRDGDLSRAKIENYLVPVIDPDAADGKPEKKPSDGDGILDTLDALHDEEKHRSYGAKRGKIKIVRYNNRVDIVVHKLIFITSILCKQEKYNQQLVDLMLYISLACLVDERVVYFNKVQDVVVNIIQKLVYYSFENAKKAFIDQKISLGKENSDPINGSFKVPRELRMPHNNSLHHSLLKNKYSLKLKKPGISKTPQFFSAEFRHLMEMVLSVTLQPKLLYQLIGNLFTAVPSRANTSLWFQFKTYLSLFLFCENEFKLDLANFTEGFQPMIEKSQKINDTRLPNGRSANTITLLHSKAGSISSSRTASFEFKKPVLGQPFTHPKVTLFALRHTVAELKYLQSHKLSLGDLAFDEDHDPDEIRQILKHHGVAESKALASGKAITKRSIAEISKGGVSAYWILLKFYCLQGLLVGLTHHLSLSSGSITVDQQRLMTSQYYDNFADFVASQKWGNASDHNNAGFKESSDDEKEHKLKKEKSSIDSMSTSLTAIFTEYLPERIPQDLDTSLVFLDARKAILFANNSVDAVKRLWDFDTLAATGY